MVVRAVCLDLDETLAVTRRDREAILSAASQAVDAPPLGRGDYVDAHRSVHPEETRTEIFRQLLEDGSATDPAELAAAYNDALVESIEPVPGAIEVVRALRRRWPVALLTNGPSRAQRSKLEALGWTDAFDAVLVTGELGKRKPNAAAFHAALEAVGVGADEAVHVGDQVEADIEGASRAGLAAVQVRYDGGPDPSPAADAVVHRSALETLPSIIEELDR